MCCAPPPKNSAKCISFVFCETGREKLCKVPATAKCMTRNLMLAQAIVMLVYEFNDFCLRLRFDVAINL